MFDIIEVRYTLFGLALLSMAGMIGEAVDRILEVLKDFIDDI